MGARVDTDAVVEANALFYRALSALDLDAMREVWHTVAQAVCVHPGWPMILGWDSIEESWSRIFQSTEELQVEPVGVRVQLVGTVAIVTCGEVIRPGGSGEDEPGAGGAHATNVFVWEGGRWRLLVHHASPVPVESAEATGRRPD